MAYTETITTGYGTRVGNSFKAIGGGFIMFILGTVLLWWNEGRAVKTDKMLIEAGNAYVEMEHPDKLDASLEGELICGTALATTTDTLTDAMFGISENAIAISREVEYYQWVEHSHEESKDKLGGKQETTITYTYEKEWTSHPVESSSFKDPSYQKKNMVLTTIENAKQYAENVTFGAYKLGESLIHGIRSTQDLPLAISATQLKQLNQNAQTAHERFYGISRKQSAAADSLEYVHQSGNVLYFGRVPGSPEIGDVRVSFRKVVPAKVTVMAVVKGDTFKPFKAKNGKRFQTIVMGEKSGDEIIDSEKDANSMWTWVLRFIGVLLVIGGLKGIFGFLETLLKVVPFVANILGWGVGAICTVVGMAWSLVVIAIAWLFYRPLLGIALLAVAAVLIWFFAFKGRSMRKAETSD